MQGITDVMRRPLALALIAGNVADVTAAPELLEKVHGARYRIADKGYDANTLRRSIRGVGNVLAIPRRTNKNRYVRRDTELPRPLSRRERLPPPQRLLPDRPTLR